MKRFLIGVLTPSSNTILEPETAAMLADLEHVSAHFSRFRVTEISLGAAAEDQFADAPMLAAADLLADAKVDVISWSGTSGSWRGLVADRRLCAAISQRTGAPATTATLSLHELLRRRGVSRFGLVTPYVEEVQKRIIATYAAEGFACVSERHLGLRDNFEFSAVSAETVERMVRDVARRDAEAIVILCTNLRGARRAAALEEELGVPVLDSVAFSLWGAFRAAGVAPNGIRGWGSLFAERA